MPSQAPETPVRSFSTRGEQLREMLTEEIISGKLVPGTRLDEQELASRFGVSRTPVREAVRHLVAMGLAKSQPHHGATVSGFDSGKIAAYLDAATELEVACARLAAMRMDTDELRELLDIHRRASEELFDEERYYEVNNQFHDAIYRGAHNEILLELSLSMRRRIGPVYRAQTTLARRARQAHAEHDRIVAAISKGDAVGAEVAMRAHMTSSAMVLERLHGSLVETLKSRNERRAESSAGPD